MSARPRRPRGSPRRPFAKVAALAAFFASSSALAQAPAAPAPPTREEVERVAPQAAEPPRATLQVESDAERAPCALDRPENENIRFTLSEVSFDGLRGLPAEALRPAYASLIGQSLPVREICNIRDRAAAILDQAGYVASVEVPEQRIADGRLRFEVVMAKLVGLRVRGDAGRGEALIARYLSRLTEREVFNRNDAERYLLLAGDLPGYAIRLALRSAGQARGEVIGEVIVQRTPASVDLTVQNYGSRELGRFGGLLRAQVFGLTGLGDRTSIAAFTTPDFEEQRTLQIAHDFRIGGEGFTLGGQFTAAWARPDLGDPALDIRSRTLFATLEGSFPFVRRQNEIVRGSIGMDYIDQDVDFGAFPLNQDRLRVAFLRLSGEAVETRAGDLVYSLAEPRWRLAANIEARRGLSIFDASDRCSDDFAACFALGAPPPPTRLEGNPQAFVFRGGLDGEFRPRPEITLAASMRAQYSSQPLLSFEEFSGGNYTIGRGYDPGAILGDKGLAIRAEARYGSAIPRARDRFAIEPFVFIDQAWAWNEEELFIIPRQEITSIGGGVRGGYGDFIRAELLVARPLDRTLLQPERGLRVLFSITARLWPWSFR